MNIAIPVHDPGALYAARYELRRAYTAIRCMNQRDPTIREMANRLDELCIEISVELEAGDPELGL